MRKELNKKLDLFIRRVLHHFPVNRNKVVLLSFDGKGYGDNPKYIAEEILRRNPKSKLVWLVSKWEYYVPDPILKVGISGRKACFELSTAKIIISNSKFNIPSYYKKKRNQFYLQTWHGDFALKYIEKEVENELKASYVAKSKADSAMTDAVISGSRLFSQILKDSFWLPEKCAILEFGIPRNDIYFRGERYREELKQALGFSPEDNILLYAPTFRDKGETDCYNLDFERLRMAMCQKTNAKWKVVVRLHPNITRRSNLFSYNEFIINGSTYSDQQELCMVSDCLITDYSSIMGDFLLMKKPVFLYVPDLERYSDRTTGRGLRDLFYQLPLSMSRTQDDLEMRIAAFDQESYRRDTESFLQTYYRPFDDGHSSERVVDYLTKVIHGKL